MNDLYIEPSGGSGFHLADYGLYLTDSLRKSLPEIQTRKVEVAGRNGLIDLTDALTGKPCFKNRTLTYNVGGRKETDEWVRAISSISNRIHGRKVKVIESIDDGYYWSGRASIGANPNRSGRIATFDITIDADPFKYEVSDTTEQMVWDTFDFDNGIDRDYSNITLTSGVNEVKIIGSEFNTQLVVKCSAACSVSYTAGTDTITQSLKAGKNTIYDFDIAEGENSLYFSGNGVTIDIIFRGCSL